MNNSDQNTPNLESVHASLADLVSMRDGETPSAAGHVGGCTFCQARLEDVYAAGSSLQKAMLFEAELPVPENAWASIQAKLADQLQEQNSSDVVNYQVSHLASQHSTNEVSAQMVNPSHVYGKPSVWSSINTAIYSLAAAVVFTGMVSLYTSQGQQQTRIETQALQASIQGLMDNSRGLESVLQEVATQNRTLALSDEAAIERLKWRLMLVDQRINESEESGEFSYEQVKALWGERIDALTELNQLYYTNQVAINDNYGTY